MNEWTVVGVLVTLIGLFITVGKPLLNLNRSITTLNLSVGHLNKRLDEQGNDLKDQKEHAQKSHQKLWDKNTEQDKTLNDHELRITRLEDDKK